mmetsp:Transcript_88332/g.248802  ORF Transcript_88332/g.248802 Transcript_88332/m.248802 type:complete len:241 (+) Transcript_88332:912-1634(+)
MPAGIGLAVDGWKCLPPAGLNVVHAEGRWVGALTPKRLRAGGRCVWPPRGHDGNGTLRPIRPRAGRWLLPILATHGHECSPVLHPLDVLPRVGRHDAQRRTYAVRVRDKHEIPSGQGHPAQIHKKAAGIPPTCVLGRLGPRRPCAEDLLHGDAGDTVSSAERRRLFGWPHGVVWLNITQHARPEDFPQRLIDQQLRAETMANLHGGLYATEVRRGDHNMNRRFVGLCGAAKALSELLRSL